MPTIENLPYTPLKPLEIKREPFFCRISQIAFNALAIIAICMGSSLVLVTLYSVSLLPTLIVSGGIGTALGVALPFFQDQENPEVNYRLGTLKQMRGCFSSVQVLKTLDEIGSLVGKNPIQRGKQLKTDLAYIKAAIPRERKDLSTIWKQFTKHIRKAR